ncbi:MAG: rhodanese-like domain-containing protein [Bacilli bacterium]|nr:rhodanese-like domain-containing protein [Bacilli bacterium]
MNNNISVLELKRILRPGINLIDIRNSTSYKLGNIPYSKNISKNELMFNPEKYLFKDRIYYIYCEKGIQSKTLVSYLNSIGYKTVNLIGGYKNYK